MSSLSSQSTQDGVVSRRRAEVARRLLLSGSMTVDDAIVAQLNGVILNEVYWNLVRPDMKYFPGSVFSRLRDIFSDPFQKDYPWQQWLEQHPAWDQAGYDQVACLLDAHVVDHQGVILQESIGSRSYNATVRLYLAKRSRQWLVWSNISHPQGHAFMAFEGPEKALSWIQTLQPENADGLKLATRHHLVRSSVHAPDQNSLVPSVALHVAFQLSELYGQFVSERENRLVEAHDKQRRITTLVNSVRADD